MAEQTQNTQTPISNAERLKSLKNGELVEMESKEVLKFLRFIEMTEPNFRFRLKLSNGKAKLKI